MSDKQDKQLEAIGKIISLTRRDLLQWQAVNPEKVPRKSNEDIIESSYVTDFKDKAIRVYRRRFRAPKITKPFGILMGGQIAESDMRWYSEVILDITNQTGESLWEFPKEEVLTDLLKIIKYKTSGAEDLINNLLEE